MALDAALLELTARELKQRLADARIDKIFEPTRDEVVLHLRTRTESHRLLVSARSGSARVCITQACGRPCDTGRAHCLFRFCVYK